MIWTHHHMDRGRLKPTHTYLADAQKHPSRFYESDTTFNPQIKNYQFSSILA
eukprot:SAG25_NODE_5011_length_714_cov_1.242276_2_plen_51_part_01